MTISKELKWTVKLIIYILFFTFSMIYFEKELADYMSYFIPLLFILIFTSLLAPSLTYQPPHRPLLEKRVGAFVGSNLLWVYKASWPFSKIFVFHEQIILVTPWRTYELKKKQVKLELYKPLGIGFSHIRITHKLQDYPKLMVFRPPFGGINEIKTRLQEIGFDFE